MLREGGIRVIRQAGLFLILLALFALASQPSQASHPGTTVLVGDATPGDDGAAPYVCGAAANPCDTIQHGVDHAASGDTVSVAAGTYVEQVVIDKPLTLSGGVGVIIESPVTLTESFSTGVDNYPVVLVEHTDGVTIDDVVVDGASNGLDNFRFMGIAYHDAGGTVSNVTVTGVRSSPLSEAQHGIGIFAHADTTARTLAVEDSVVTDYQKAGMAFLGPSLTVDVDGNTVVGAGGTDVIAQIGIQVGFGASGVLSDNGVGFNAFTPGTLAAAGVLLYEAAPGVELSLNALTANSNGLYVQRSDGVAIEDNEIGPNSSANVFALESDTGSYHLNTLTDANSGLWLSGSSETTVTQNTIDGNVHGIVIEGDSIGADVTMNDITNNTGLSSGIHVQSFDGGSPSEIEVHDNDILDNDAAGGYGVFNSTAIDVDATDNNWGFCSGPSGVGVGKGDAVSEHVIYLPWDLTGCNLAADDDGDGLSNGDEINVHGTSIQERDTDGDGCDDNVELGPDASQGGLRNPLNRWDFYDTNGDATIDLPNDIEGVIFRWSGNPGLPYDVAYDRGPSTGPDPWNMTAPDGVIDLANDILGVILQWQHNCS